MATTTDRLAFRQPEATDDIDVEADFQDNWAITEQHPGMRVCASYAQPRWGGAQTGMLAYETDTGSHLSWLGGDFTRLRRSASPVQQAFTAKTGDRPLLNLAKNQETPLVTVNVLATPGSTLGIRASGGQIGSPSSLWNRGVVWFYLQATPGDTTRATGLYHSNGSVSLSMMSFVPESSDPTVAVAVTLYAKAREDNCWVGSNFPIADVTKSPPLILSVGEV